MTKVFISYSHKDEAWKDRLQTQLAVLEMDGLLSVWEDRQIALGDSWYPEIETALNTADVAILLISADFLTSKFIRGEEIPRLLERREQQGIRVIPLILKPCPWKKVGWLNAMQGASRDNVPLSTLVEHQQDDILCKLAEKIHDLVGTCRSGFSPTISPATPTIHSDRLPTVKGGFFGRTTELQLLNDAWQEETLTPQPPLPRSGRGGGRTRIIQFIAPGGTGKTKLLRHWLDHTTDIPVLIAWSFYSQGASEDKQTSASPFFSHAFEKLDSTQEQFASEEDKGDHLAELLRGKRYVLVLDGLEPLQHGGAAMRGELKDKALRQLLRQLARHPSGLCIITTRIALHELSDRDAPTVIRHELQNLTAADGIQLLQSLEVKGSEAELGKAVGEYGGHALALSLLGNVLRLRHQGDVRKRDTLKALIKPTGSKESRHAFKVMQAYAEWFAGEPELALLHLLGLFDHPIGQEVLQMLWDAQIPHLTAGIDEDAWLEAIASLREEHHLLSQHDSGGNLDCHPLIREYFGGQLQTQQPQAWQQAHERLYEYYKALPKKELPDTLEEMQPLFSAVAHGCHAGLYQQAAQEFLWSRVQQREDGAYNVKKLGSFSSELAAATYFFDKPWHKPVTGLTNIEKLFLLKWISFCLVPMGRLKEALEPIMEGVKLSESQGDWGGAAQDSGKLSRLQIFLGRISEAIESGKNSVSYADKSGDSFQIVLARTIHADAWHQAGEIETALNLFREAEQLQQEYEPTYLRSLVGFSYGDLLLALGSTEEVLERANNSLKKLAQATKATHQNNELLLIIGRAYLQQEDFSQAAHWLGQAVAGLRILGQQDYLPRGLLACAALHRHTHDFDRAQADLQEVFDIADGSGMRLYLTDYHLEMARLLVAEEKTLTPTPLPRSGRGANTGESVSTSSSPSTAQRERGAGGEGLQYHIAAAAKLIEETGYHRRDQELLDLQQALAKES